MTPAQIKQALKVRELRADQAERTYNLARATQAEAFQALNYAQGKLADFDASYESRIAAFFEKTASGLSPDSLHSARVFHADLGQERFGIVDMIGKAEHAVDLAGRYVAQRRKVWATASQAADNIGKLYASAMTDVAREQERREEMDADELSVSRAFRDAG